MNELLKVNYDSDRITVSARELHKFLGATERFSNWFERMSQYGMVEGEDFASVKSFTLVNNGARREIQDYQLEVKETTITHADGHISISKTVKVTGKGQVYFINKLLASA